MKKISEGVREFGLSYRQILQFRQLHAGGVDVTVRHLLFTLRQRLHPQVQLETNHRQVMFSHNFYVFSGVETASSLKLSDNYCILNVYLLCSQNHSSTIVFPLTVR